MRYQDKVTPEGDIVFAKPHGTLIGNRGELHDAQGHLVRTHTSAKAWITCALNAADGSKRPRREPGHYTVLFFLDEVTALAAGHRPCWECRREAYKAFQLAWAKSRGQTSVSTAANLDATLAKERDPEMRPVIDDLHTLPDGAMVKRHADGVIWLRHAGAARSWSFEGYGPAVSLDALSGPFTVLTPATTLAILAAGYVPEVRA